MSEYRRKIVIAGVLAVILVASLALVSAYFFQQTQPPIPPPLPTPTPTPTPAPTPTPHPAPPPEFTIKAGLEPSEGALGFNYTPIESQGFISKILVLPPGGSGTIPVTLVSKSDKDYAITLYIEPEGLGDARLFRGIRFTFSPTSMLLRAGGTESSLLKIKVDPDAPTGFYGPSVGGRTEEFGLSSSESYFNLLVLPYTPSYAFYIYAQPPGPAPIPTPPPTPTPTQPPAPPPPTIDVKTGDKVHVMFGIQTFSDDPNLPIQFNYTYNSKPAGSLPSEVSANLVSNPLQVVRVPIEERFYMLTLSAGPDAPEGTYEIVVTGSVGSYTFERAFYLVVKGS